MAAHRIDGSVRTVLLLIAQLYSVERTVRQRGLGYEECACCGNMDRGRF